MLFFIYFSFYLKKYINNEKLQKINKKIEYVKYYFIFMK